MAVKNQYSIVGRHMDGRGVTGYQVAIEGKGSRKLTREQVCFLVGRRQIANCEGQVYADKVILRGVGVNLDELPIIADKTGAVTNTANVGAVRKGTDAVSAVNQLMLVGQLVSGRNTVGYIVANAGGVKKKLSRDDVLKFAKAGRLGNARTQEYNGRTILRGVGINLNELPVTNVGQPKDPNASAPVRTALSESSNIVPIAESKLLNIPKVLAHKAGKEACLENIKKRFETFELPGGPVNGLSNEEIAYNVEAIIEEVSSYSGIACRNIAYELRYNVDRVRSYIAEEEELLKQGIGSREESDEYIQDAIADGAKSIIDHGCIKKDDKKNRENVLKFVTKYSALPPNVSIMEVLRAISVMYYKEEDPTKELRELLARRSTDEDPKLVVLNRTCGAACALIATLSFRTEAQLLGPNVGYFVNKVYKL